MAYRDGKRIKAPDGIKCRLDDYDQERLEEFLDINGGQPAVVARQALVEFLDRRDIQYAEPIKQKEFQQRKVVLAVGDRIRVMKTEMKGEGAQDISHMIQQ
jgi:predicted transcriptional regulator